MNTTDNNSAITQQSVNEPYHPLIGTIFTLIICLGLTFGLVYIVQQATDQETQKSFDSRVENAKQLITNKMNSYQDVLVSAKGLFVAEKEVNREEFQSFIDTQQLNKTLTNLEAVGYSLIVPPAKKNIHQSTLYAQGFSNYSIFPDGERDIYAPVIYVEPFSESNYRNFGYDMYSEPVRHAAMQKALESDQPTLSGKVDLIPDASGEVHPGFFMYIPVYRQNTPHSNLDERQQNAIGWIFAMFHLNDFMNNIFVGLEEDLNIQIFDGDSERPEAKLYSSKIAADSSTKIQKLSKQLDLIDHKWTIVVRPTASLKNRANNNPILFTLFGIAISLLISLLVWTLLNSRSKAIKTVKKLHAELIAEHEQFVETKTAERRALDQLRSQKFALDQHVIISLTDLQGRIFYVNEKFCQLTGYASHEIAGRSHSLISSGHHPNSFFTDMYNTILSGQIWQMEICNRKKNGELFWLETTIVPNLDSEHKPFEFIAISTDITERKAAEDKLKEKKQRLDLATKAGGIGIWDYDVVNNILLWDDIMFNLYGEDKDTFIATYDSWRIHVHPEDLPRVELDLRNAINDIRPFKTEFRVIQSDGSIHTLEAVAEVVRDVFENPIRLIGVNWDITEKRIIESVANERKTMLNELYEFTPLGISMADMDGHFVEFNQAFAIMCGYSTDELKQLDYWHLTPAKYAADETRVLEELKQNGKFGPYEKEYIRKDGSLISLCFSGVLITRADGKSYIWSIVEDISQRKSTEKQLQEITKVSIQRRQEAEALAEAKTKFLANMSHEIRTPMNGVIGLSELALGSNDGDEIKEYLKEINNSSLELMKILNDILDLSKLESHEMKIEKIPFKLNTLIDSLHRLFTLNAQTSGVAFSIHCDDDVPTNLKGDNLRVRQILTNLLANAFKFTKDGDISLNISRSTTQNSTHPSQVRLSFRVKDTGIGIAPDHLKSIFNPFTQADSSITRHFGGTGLGLTISRQLAEIMGGTIEIENSKVGVGSTFLFEANFEFETETAKPAISPQPLLPDNTSQLQGKRVLLVEDNRINQLVTSRMLEKLGIQFDIASNGEIAVKDVFEKTYDLVLMDIQMPVLDGLGATQQIRENGNYAKLPIVAMSAGVTLEEKTACRDAGMNGFISKPTVFSELKRALLEHLGNENSI